MRLATPTRPDEEKMVCARLVHRVPQTLKRVRQQLLPLHKDRLQDLRRRTTRREAGNEYWLLTHAKAPDPGATTDKSVESEIDSVRLYPV
jgi:hypothetical protein